jgi:hypothetical protein
VIGVLCAPTERRVAEEFFQLFKVVWRFWDGDPGSCDVLLATTSVPPEAAEAVRLVVVYGQSSCASEGGRVVRHDYDLFTEVGELLETGQPSARAATPTLDGYVQDLRRAIVDAGLVLVEIPPVREGRPYGVCLTHDIDFFQLRRHRFDRTAVGFAWRALTGPGPLRRRARNWLALLALPLVHLRILRDPWQPFESYAAADAAPATYFVVPFADRPGVGAPARRAVKHDVSDLREALEPVVHQGCEVALHGIDAWDSVDAARAEREHVATHAATACDGVRMHWLYFDEGSPARLDAAGFSYDASCGFNDAVGFRAGTAQVYKPLASERLLELPLHVQDTSLFYAGRMGLDEEAARGAVASVRDSVREHGGVLTVSWHDRSLVPERCWDGFYTGLLEMFRRDGAWFATAREMVEWFRLRRSLELETTTSDDGRVLVRVRAAQDFREAGFVVRVHVPGDGGGETVDVPARDQEISVPIERAEVLAVA